jgi:hypothetical protein
MQDRSRQSVAPTTRSDENARHLAQPKEVLETTDD